MLIYGWKIADALPGIGLESFFSYINAVQWITFTQNDEKTFSVRRKKLKKWIPPIHIYNLHINPYEWSISGLVFNHELVE